MRIFLLFGSYTVVSAFLIIHECESKMWKLYFPSKVGGGITMAHMMLKLPCKLYVIKYVITVQPVTVCDTLRA